ncbi:MAG: type II secretion system F family protein [Magnetospiraceae bacterium]
MNFTVGGNVFNIGPEVLVFLIVGVGVVVLFAIITLVMVSVMRPRLRMKRRLALIGVEVDSRRLLSDKSDNRRQRRIQDRVRQLEDTAKKTKKTGKLKLDLIQAGLDVPPSGYVIFSVALGVIVLGVTFLLGLPFIVPFLLAIVAGVGLPKFFLKYLAKKRQKAFTELFADAIDVIVRGIRSGLPVTECLNIVGREFADPVGNEFRLMVEGQSLGLSIEELMRRALERIPTADFKFFAIVLQIQKQTGGNLAETLAGLSNVLRGRKKLKDKIAALSSEAKASAGIIGSLPVFVGSALGLLNPDYIGLLFTEDLGQYMLFGGLVWGGIGVTVMAKMINFEV